MIRIRIFLIFFFLQLAIYARYLTSDLIHSDSIGARRRERKYRNLSKEGI